MVVIIAAGPLTLRKGRRRQTFDGDADDAGRTMVTANATSSTPASGSPVRIDVLTGQAERLQLHMAMNEPTMKTLKCEKLISSRMP